MALLNASFANMMGRNDLAASSAAIGAPPIAVVIGGSTQAYNSDTSPVTGGGRIALIGLLVLIGGYAAFTWWVKPLLA